MSSIVCRICSLSTEKIFSTIVLQKHSVEYFKCSHCGYVQTESPFWLKEAYSSPINDVDTGLLMRSYWHRNVTSTLIYILFNQGGKFLDYGGGYGVFVRLMRDIGFNFYWHDKHTENLFAKGFEFGKSDHNPVELLTCFEVFEHFAEPAIELENLLNISNNILLSTEFIPDPVPDPAEWWYYDSEHGQHIGFFQQKTFEYLADKHSLYFYSNGKNIHLLSKKRLLKPAFKWLTKVSKFINPLIQKRMESLTWQDFETLKAEIS